MTFNMAPISGRVGSEIATEQDLSNMRAIESFRSSIIKVLRDLVESQNLAAMRRVRDLLEERGKTVTVGDPEQQDIFLNFFLNAMRDISTGSDKGRVFKRVVIPTLNTLEPFAISRFRLFADEFLRIRRLDIARLFRDKVRPAGDADKPPAAEDAVEKAESPDEIRQLEILRAGGGPEGSVILMEDSNEFSMNPSVAETRVTALKKFMKSVIMDLTMNETVCSGKIFNPRFDLTSFLQKVIDLKMESSCFEVLRPPTPPRKSRRGKPPVHPAVHAARREDVHRSPPLFAINSSHKKTHRRPKTAGSSLRSEARPPFHSPPPIMIARHEEAGDGAVGTAVPPPPPGSEPRFDTEDVMEAIKSCQTEEFSPRTPVPLEIPHSAVTHASDPGSVVRVLLPADALSGGGDAAAPHDSRVTPKTVMSTTSVKGGASVASVKSVASAASVASASSRRSTRSTRSTRSSRSGLSHHTRTSKH
jgi:hypothetical protein